MYQPMLASDRSRCAVHIVGDRAQNTITSHALIASVIHIEHCKLVLKPLTVDREGSVETGANFVHISGIACVGILVEPHPILLQVQNGVVGFGRLVSLRSRQCYTGLKYDDVTEDANYPLSVIFDVVMIGIADCDELTALVWYESANHRSIPH